MLAPVLKKNDKLANWLIILLSLVVFVIIAALSRVKFNADPGFNVHIFAKASAVINSVVTLLLLAGLYAVKQGKYLVHKKIMLFALILSVLFLLSYICHHLLAGDARFGDINHDGLLSDEEKEQAGGMRKFYYIILLTHIPLAGIILPFILFTAYRALIAEFPKHKKLARITWPIWFYVSFTGVLIYLLISPYY